MTLRSEIDDLASALCKKATDKDTPIEASTDALKAIASYYAVRSKVDAKAGDDGGEGTFDDFHSAITGVNPETSHGRPAQPPPSHRRNS